MNNSLAFGTFVQGKSRVHQMNAQVKIILACVFSLGAFFVSSWAGMCLFAFAIVLGYAFSGIKLSRAMAGLSPVLLVLLFTVLAHVFAGSPQAAPALSPWAEDAFGWETASVGLWGGFTASAAGLAAGLFLALRIALLVAACCLLTFTTPPLQVTDGLSSLLAPLRVLRVPTDDVCLVISIAIRFVPIVTEEAYSLRRSHEARGLAFEGAGPVVALRSWGNVLVPLFVRLFQRSDKLALALDARCYGNQGRTNLRAAKPTAAEGALCLLGCIAVIAVAVFL